MSNHWQFTLHVYYSCPAGYYCPKSGADDYKSYPCEPDHFCPKGSNTSIPCDPGTYNPQIKATNQSWCITDISNTSSEGLKPNNAESGLLITIAGVSVGLLCLVAVIRIVVRGALKKFRISSNHHVNSHADFNLNTFFNTDDTSVAVTDNDVCQENAAENRTITALSPDSIYNEINDEIYDVINESDMDSIACSIVGDHAGESDDHRNQLPSASNECVLQSEGLESVSDDGPLTDGIDVEKIDDDNIIYVDNATCVDISD